MNKYVKMLKIMGYLFVGVVFGRYGLGALLAVGF